VKLKDINIPKEIIKEVGWKPDDSITIKPCDVYSDKDMTVKYKTLVIKKEKK